MVADTVKHAFRRIWWSLVIRGALALALGLFILAKPLESVAAFALVIAIWALAAGITEIGQAIEVKPFFRSWWMLLLGGIVSVGFGVAALYYYPVLSLAFAVTWVAFWLASSGVFGISAAMMQRREHLPWGWTFTWALLSLAASVAAWAAPLATLRAVMTLISAVAIVGGIALLIGAFRFRALVRRAEETFHPPFPPGRETKDHAMAGAGHPDR